MPDGTTTTTMIRRAAPLRPTASTLNREARTVEAIAATRATVRQPPPSPMGAYAPWGESLDMAGADLSRFVGAPVLLDHQNRTDHLVGTVEAAWMVNGELHARLRFATTARGEEAMVMIGGGILSGVSIGYSVTQYERDGETFIARRWAPMELSLTPIPADGAARIRAADTPSLAPKDSTMTTDTTTEHVAQTRAASLLPIVTTARGLVPQDALDTIHTRAQSEGWTAEALRSALWDAAVQAAPRPSIPATQVGDSYDDPAVRMNLRAEALAAQILGRAPTGPARQYMAHRGFTGMAQATLEERGVKVRGLSSSDLIGEALNVRMHTTGDFPNLLTGTGNRVLTGLRDAAPSPLRAVSKPREVPDFRPFKTITAAGPASLTELPEGGSVQYTTFFESAETGQLATYARNVSLTRQMLVNDDLGAMAAAARFWVSGIAATERALFLAMFATNGDGWGPTMADTLPLFHATHANATTGTATTTGISNARKAMREMTDLNGNLLAVGPAILLTGPTSETGLEQAVSSITIATTEGNRPIFSNLRIEVEAGLTGVPFFAFADPMVSPVLEYVTLAGRGGAPAFETFSGADRDGVVMRCTHDVAVFACGWTGAVRVTGA
jgi:hypothetical protein